MLLEGEALAVWLELSGKQQQPYATVKKELSTALMPMEFVLLDNFYQHTMLLGEALLVFVHNLKKVLEHAVTKLDAQDCGPLLLRQFVAEIPLSVTRQLRATGEVKTLDVAVA